MIGGEKMLFGIELKWWIIGILAILFIIWVIKTS